MIYTILSWLLAVSYWLTVDCSMGDKNGGVGYPALVKQGCLADKA